MEAIIDARVLLPQGHHNTSVESSHEYLDRLERWLSHDFLIAPGGQEYLFDQFSSEYGWPADPLPMEVALGIPRNLVSKVLYPLLSTTFTGLDFPLGDIERPEYLGDEDSKTAMQIDFSFAADSDARYIISDDRHWESLSPFIYAAGGGRVELVVDVDMIPRIKLAKLVQAHFENRRLYIVGGNKDDRACDKLSDIGVPGKSIIWIELQKNQSPSIIGSRLSGLRAGRSTVICLTGSISHAGYFQAKDSCESAGAPFIICEGTGGVQDAVISFVLGKLLAK